MKITRTIDDVGSHAAYPANEAYPQLEDELGTERRLEAIFRVFSRLPEQDYQALESAARSFHWHIPEWDSLGSVAMFPVTHTVELDERTRPGGARVLYLSPALERMPLRVVVGTVANELAHVLLNHQLVADRSAAAYAAHEDDAWSQVKRWGFAKEGEAAERAIGRISRVSRERARQREEREAQKYSPARWRPREQDSGPGRRG